MLIYSPAEEAISRADLPRMLLALGECVDEESLHRASYACGTGISC
jgi:hypothetical protein